MKLLLTSDNKATLTAQTINGPVTIPLREKARMLTGVWRQFASHSPRKRWQTIAPGISQLTI